MVKLEDIKKATETAHESIDATAEKIMPQIEAALDAAMMSQANQAKNDYTFQVYQPVLAQVRAQAPSQINSVDQIVQKVITQLVQKAQEAGYTVTSSTTLESIHLTW